MQTVKDMKEKVEEKKKDMKIKVKNAKKNVKSVKGGLHLKPKYRKNEVLTCNGLDSDNYIYAFETGKNVIHTMKHEWDWKSFNADWKAFSDISVKWSRQFADMSEQDLESYIEDVKPYMPTYFLNKINKDLIYVCRGQNPKGQVDVLLLPGRQFKIRSCKKVWGNIFSGCYKEAHYEYKISIVGDDKTIIKLKESKIDEIIA